MKVLCGSKLSNLSTSRTVTHVKMKCIFTRRYLRPWLRLADRWFASIHYLHCLPLLAGQCYIILYIYIFNSIQSTQHALYALFILLSLMLCEYGLKNCVSYIQVIININQQIMQITCVQLNKIIIIIERTKIEKGSRELGHPFDREDLLFLTIEQMHQCQQTVGYNS